ncbi:protein translocase subunit SecD [Naasia lichenicola]|uniref:Protein translocase subunit SecD n=1 Tax=Naasia lichenicola TaxID=2565933 RepID=A0A4S4FRV7_9MICO|nr:protein translocase subunit SecD [Naasia lichenicola]THG33031.1 protein translocase subunit SecD [Naasia lichenicola]
MAKTTSPVRKAWRSLAILGGIIVALVGVNLAGVLIPGAGGQWAPKLALDLEGGTQIILAPVVDGDTQVSQEQLNQAVSIIRQRIDSAGVSESEITTQGASNIVVSIPGQPDEQTLERIEASAKLEFRPVLLAGTPSTDSIGGTDSATPTPTPTPSVADTPAPAPTDASDVSQVTPALQTAYDAFDCSDIDSSKVAPADQPLVTCETDGSIKYILGPVEIDGADVSNAMSGVVSTSTGASTGQWAVNIDFNDQGAEEFGAVTARLIQLTSPRNQFGIVLDGRVISAPVAQAVITDGNAQITGNFDQETSKSLADQLKYGALPISFTVQSSDVISATLGSSQLQSGLIAGLIGLILVVIYSLIQYRTLGFVTVASLVVASVITYLLITFLSWREGYRLSLAGVAGLIVAIGITADSFIVYFERIRDELRDGRGLSGAVEAGWKRALRTIIASDTVNFLAAIVLFLVAIGNVRGFALTLGLTTIIDLIVVTLFTHPVLQLISKTRFFSEGHRLSGLDPRALGAVYRGRAEFRPPAVSTARTAASRGEAARRQTIAERKAAESAPTQDTRVPAGVDSGATGTSSTTATGTKTPGTKNTGTNSSSTKPTTGAKGGKR